MTSQFLTAAISIAAASPATRGPLLGTAAMASVFLLVLIWLLVMPRHLLGQQPGERVPWWRNIRLWAALVAIAQIAVYVVWG